MNEVQNIAMGELIKKYREQYGWTQELLAEFIEISTVHLSRIETGKVTPRVDILIRLSKVLQVSLDELMLGGTRTTCNIQDMRALVKDDHRFVLYIYLLFYEYLFLDIKI